MAAVAVTDSFLSAVLDQARAMGSDPEALLRVWYFESAGLNPKAVSPDGDHFGLNQLNSGYLRSHGIDPKTYVTWSAEQQLPVVMDYVRYLAAHFNGGEPFTDAVRYYIANFLPGRLSRMSGSDGAVLTQSPEKYYEGNKDLDIGKKGSITVGDIRQKMAAVAASPHYQAIVARLAQLGGGGGEGRPGGAGPALALLLGLGIGAMLTARKSG